MATDSAFDRGSKKEEKETNNGRKEGDRFLREEKLIPCEKYSEWETNNFIGRGSLIKGVGQ